MRMHKQMRWLLPSLVLAAGLVQLHAQAPASLTGFSNTVLRLQGVTNVNSSALRLFPTAAAPYTNGSALVSGGVISTTGNATNATYAQLAADRALLVIYSKAAESFRGTNQVTLQFASATNGTYTTIYSYSTFNLPSTSTGVFSLVPGTNVVPFIYASSSSTIVQSNLSPNIAVTADGFGLKYQWRLNNTDVPNATNLNYVVANISPAKEGAYVCVITNSAGAVTSSVINVSIAKPIVFTQQPQPQTVLEGSYVSLSFAVTGDITGIQWLQNGFYPNFPAGGPSSVVNTTNYVMPIIAANQAGNYSAQVNGHEVTTNSQSAAVSVRAKGTEALWLNRPFVKIADDRQMLVPNGGGHVFTNWAGGASTPLLTFRDGKVHFVAGTSAGVRSLFRWASGVLSTLVFTNTPNPLGGFFGDIFYPTDEGAGVVNFSGNSAVNGGMFAYSTLGISNVIGTNTVAPGQAYPFGGSGSYGRRNSGVAISSTLFSSPGSYNIVGTGMYFHDGSNITRLCDNTTDLPGALTGYAGRPTANSVNFDGTNVVFATITGGGPGGFFKSTPGGTITKLADHTDPLPENSLSTFGGFGDLDVDGGWIFGVANNKIYAFDGAGSVTNIGNGSNLSAAGPRQVYYHNGSTLYRWNDGVRETVLAYLAVVDGKQVSSILGMDAEGDNVCVLLRFADNSYGIYVVSGTANANPTINSEPLDFNVIENGSASFYVSAAGQGPLNYQWFKDGSSLASRTNASLVLNPAQAGDVGGYSVIVSNLNGSVTSRVAQLTRTIPAAPLILSGPVISPVGTTFGGNATISLTAAGQGISYTWYRNELVLPGANTNFIALTNLGAADRTNYFCVISNSASVVTSSVVTLTIAPVITQHPVPVTNVLGGTASFTVAAIGVPPITYQWRRINTAIPGATNATLTLTNLVATNAAFYRVLVGSGGSSALSGASLTIQAATPNGPLLSAPVVVNGQFHFLLPTQNGLSYQVQSKTNLAAADWTPEQTIPGDGTVKLVTVDATAAQKWVRVMAQ